jgi:hypothetical protein
MCNKIPWQTNGHTIAITLYVRPSTHQSLLAAATWPKLLATSMDHQAVDPVACHKYPYHVYCDQFDFLISRKKIHVFYRRIFVLILTRIPIHETDHIETSRLPREIWWSHDCKVKYGEVILAICADEKYCKILVPNLLINFRLHQKSS